MELAPATRSAAAPAASLPANDALSALLNLGYRRPEAQAALAASLERLGAAAPLPALITAALRELAPK
jgi:Holliday junction DNA helicase RuvA